MHRKAVYGLVGTIGLSLVCLAGCQHGATKQGTLYSVEVGGTLDTYESADIQVVHDAALAVVKDEFHYDVVSAKVDATEGLITAKTARNRDVLIETFKVSDHVTRIKVHVAGEAVLGQSVLDAIEERILHPAAK